MTDVSRTSRRLNPTVIQATDVNMSDVLVRQDYNVLTGIAKEYFGQGVETYFSNLSDANKPVYLHVEDKRVDRLDMCSQSLMEVPNGIDKLVNLRELHLRGNQIKDVSELGNLLNLRALRLSDNQVEDVSGLGDLVNLEWLGLGGNQIKDVSGLSNLVNLRELVLGGNPNLDCNSENNKKVIDKLKARGCNMLYYF